MLLPSDMDKEKASTVPRPTGQLLRSCEKLHLPRGSRNFVLNLMGNITDRCGRWLKIPPKALRTGFGEAYHCWVLSHTSLAMKPVFFPRPESHLKGDFQEQTLQGCANYVAAAYLIDASY